MSTESNVLSCKKAVIVKSHLNLQTFSCQTYPLSKKRRRLFVKPTKSAFPFGIRSTTGFKILNICHKPHSTHLLY